MSLNQLFEISRRSFRVLDAGMNTVADNVANAGTAGFSRRRVTMRADAVVSTGPIMRTPLNTATGAGVSIGGYERMRDGLLAASAHDARTGLGAAQEEARLVGALEAAFPTGDASISSLLDGFWDAWADLANYPTDTGVRRALRSQTSALADGLHHTAAGLDALEAGTRADVGAHVETVNRLLRDVAALNETLGTARAGGSPDLAGEDRRDQLVQQLSEFVPVEVRDEGPAGYTLLVDGITAVHGAHAVGLELDESGPTPRLGFEGMQVEYQPAAGRDGRLGAAFRTLTETLPEARAALDELAATVVSEVNALHQTGYGLDGATGRDFFDPAGTTAATLRLSTAVAADPAAIAASADPAAAGDNGVALGLAGLRTAPILGGGTATPSAFLADLGTALGSRIERATTEAAGQAAVVDHLDALERGVSGVSLDEEMTKLIEYQQAFAASARVLETAQSMIDTLLAM